MQIYHNFTLTQQNYSELMQTPVVEANHSFITEMSNKIKELSSDFWNNHCRFDAKPPLPLCSFYKFNLTSWSKNSEEIFSPYTYIYSYNTKDADQEWLKKIDQVLALEGSPRLIEEGVSGSYLIRDKQGNPLAIYKPENEAAGAANNPKGFHEFSFDFKEAAVREHAAWLVGREFMHIPETHLVKVIQDGKEVKGSLQKYVNNDGNGRDLLMSTTLKGILTPVDQIHRLALFDLMIQNKDRGNHYNLLYSVSKDSKISLIPIDHNLAFSKQVSVVLKNGIRNSLIPTYLSRDASKESFSQETLKAIKSIDRKSITAKMKEAGMSEERIFTFNVMCLFVQKSVEAGMNLDQIENVITGRMTNFSLYKGLSKLVEALMRGTPLEKNIKDFFTSDLEDLVRTAKIHHPDDQELFFEELAQLLSTECYNHITHRTAIEHENSAEHSIPFLSNLFKWLIRIR